MRTSHTNFKGTGVPVYFKKQHSQGERETIVQLLVPKIKKILKATYPRGEEGEVQGIKMYYVHVPTPHNE